MTARYYSTENDTLPPYSKNNLGDMIVAVKAALITGYKDQQPAGWELLYESINNPGDTSKRIAVRSKSADSEQKVFEIGDISNIEGSIKCYDDWIGDTGVNLLMQAKINKNCWGGAVEIVANESFVHLVVNAVYMCFGDMDVFDTSMQKTIIFDMQNTNSADYDHAIASTVNQGRTQFRKIDNKRLICRSFCKDQLGFGSRIYWSASPSYDWYNGGDRGDLITGILTPVRKVELMQIIDMDRRYYCMGYLPMMVYTDNPRTMLDVGQINMDGKNKRLVGIQSDGGALHLYAVDV